MTIPRRTSVNALVRPNRQAEICIVHLVRKANGWSPFLNFLDSYRRHAAGVDHELALVLKGFDDQRDAEPYRDLAAGLCKHWLSVDDHGYDLGTYRNAALALPHSKLLFVNSFSVIQAGDWLAGMASVAASPRVGIVGASASWGSRSSHARYSIGLGGPYRNIFDDPDSTSQAFLELTAGEERAYSASSSLGHWGRAYLLLIRELTGFPAFPAPHLRTNGFLIDRELWLRICPQAPRNKLAAYRLESGRHSITNKVRRTDMHVLVVGRDGHGYELDDWPESHTFWQGSQENLLVSDNQTRAYEGASARTRLVLSRYAWGPHAAPAEALEPQ